jgi:CRP-like cAMP-binding protein
MKEYLEQFEIFNATEIEDFLKLGREKKFKANDFFIEEGAFCQEIGFIVSGIFRSFYYSDIGDQITYCFRFSESLLSAYSSYITGKATPENIQAITDATVILFQKKDFEALLYSNPKWLLVSKIIGDQEYLEMEQRVFTLQKDRAETRYRNLLKDHPEYLQLIPLQYIASYLGITQRHLSRIRKEIAN